jgi:archaellum component FlaG (FlaF/FlaG flagellin family)
MYSIEVMILIIAGIIAASSVGLFVISETTEWSNVLETQGEEKSNQIKEDIKIISDIGSDNLYNTGSNELTLHVQNTGRIVVDKERLNLFINGEYTTIDSVTIVGNDNIWDEGDVAIINTTKDVSGETRVKVSTERANSDTVVINI